MSKLRATLSLALLTLALAQGAAARHADSRPLYRLSLPGRDWALDYAAEHDPTYAPFQLALAHYYAKAGDLDNTIAYLEKAFRKDAAGEPPPLPDPKDDPAFERFRKDEKFRKAVKALKK